MKKLLTFLIFISLIGCKNDTKKEVIQDNIAEEIPVISDEIKTNTLKDVYWGDTHVHTGWSMDAGLDGATLSPEDAYRFALGESITSNSGLQAKIKYPYDWFLVSDHSDAMGVINNLIDGNEEMMQVPVMKKWSEALKIGGEAATTVKSDAIRMQANGELPELMMDPKWMVDAWERTIETAEKFNTPGKFTTFIAYEWTVNADGGNNLHRNVIFRDGADRARQVIPLTTFETQEPKKLWEWMEAYETKTGGQLLAIPHNGNLSNGRMFEEKQFDGTPMTKKWVEMRARFEPLFELYQIKGQSEAHPSLSPTDEFADYELWDRGNLILLPKPKGALKTEYWREALKSGMRIEKELGTNPFKYGANAATDTHTGISSTEEDNFWGKFKSLEISNKDRWDFPLLEGETDTYMGWEQSTSGFMGVWAESNTREAIWDAMMRKETYATTGPRMKVRFFGGFNFSENDLSKDIAEKGYANGVPMGGDLKFTNNKTPNFIISAIKDPNGANLDRIQVIKGWLDANGKTHEKIYEVKWSGNRQLDSKGKLPAIENTVNLENATYTNTVGTTELKVYFTDPDFDPLQSAFYYVRVLEIPTPRWTLYDKVKHNLTLPAHVPLTHQGRIATSPIWYNPN